MEILGRYPFLKDYALQYLRDKKIDMDDLLKSRAYEEEREIAFNNIYACLKNESGMFKDWETRFLSYLISKIFLSSLGDDMITGRYANFERDILETNMQEDLVDISEDSMKTIREISSELGISLDIEEENNRLFFTIPFTQYIHYSGALGEKYKLLYQKLRNGHIWIERRRDLKDETNILRKILREAFVVKFKKEVEESEVSKDVKLLFKEKMEKVKQYKSEILSKYKNDIGKIESEYLPPCIKSIIANVQNGVNIGHEARFSMVAFLHHAGMNNEEILSIFSSAPDFNEKLTRYQVDHITGKSSGTEYSTPDCRYMEVSGLCVKDVAKDSLCKRDWMKHPFTYYKTKKKSAKNLPSS